MKRPVNWFIPLPATAFQPGATACEDGVSHDGNGDDDTTSVVSGDDPEQSQIEAPVGGSGDRMLTPAVPGRHTVFAFTTLGTANVNCDAMPEAP